MYFEAPDHPRNIQWSDQKERELWELHNDDIDMNETDIVVSTKQISNSICSNVKLLSTPEKQRI